MYLPQYITNTMQTLIDKGYEVYVVGGAVRNILLQKPNDNWDLTTNATPEVLQKLFPNNFYHNTYGTVTIKHEENGVYTPIEITPYRKEGTYSDNRHPDHIEWASTLEEDLQRRDFTIGSMAMDIHGNLIDPLGAKTDFDNKIIRAVGDPQKRFAEDALRLLRAIRFATQLQFRIENNTFEALQKAVATIQHISGERIRDELFKILSSAEPHKGIMLLKESGLLQYILPELEACFAISQISPGRHHKYDVGTHSVLALAHCRSKSSIARLATLLHDIGKVPTYLKDEETGMVTFYNHEVAGQHLVESIADRLRLSAKDTAKLSTMVRWHMFTVNETATDSAIKRFIRNVGIENLEDMIHLRTADRLGSGARETSWRYDLFKKRLVEVQKEPFSVKDLNITGNDVMETLGIPPGRKVGDILQVLFEKVENKELENTKEELLKELQHLS